MNDLTPEKLAELRRMLGEVESTAWRTPERDRSTVVDPAGWVVATCTYGKSGEPYAALISAAVNSLPALLDAADERDALATAVERVRAVLAWIDTAEVRCGKDARIDDLIRVVALDRIERALDTLEADHA